MVAAVLELIGIPRPPIGLRMSSSPPAAAPLISSAGGGSGGSGGRGSILPEFRGLRLSLPPRRASSASGSVITKCDRKRVVVCEAQESTALEVPDVTKETWQSLVMESDRPVLVEFWAEWCGPCLMISPVIAKMSKVYESRLKCFKLNTDESPDIVTQYGVRSIPTIIIFNNGEKKETVIGSVPESTLVTYIDRFLER